MPNALLARRRVFAGKQEVTLGTAVALANTDATVKVRDPKLEIVSEVVKIDNQGGFGTAQSAPAGGRVTSSFTCLATGSSTTPSWASIYLQACGMSLSSRTYSLTSDTSVWKGLTLGLFQDGRRKRGRGMMGNVKMVWRAGKPVEVQFDFLGGAVEDPTDTALLTGMTYATEVAPIFAGSGSLTLAGSASNFKVNEITVDFGNALTVREDPNSYGGILCGWIGNRQPTVTMDPETLLAATKSWHASFSSAEEVGLTLVAGATANNIITLTASAIQLEKTPEDTDRDGKLADNLSFQVNSDGLTVAFS